MFEILKEKLGDVLKAFAPLVVVVSALQVAILQAPIDLYVQFMVGSALAIIGLILLFLGIERGVLPMGRYIGAELPKRGSLWLIIAVAFGFGFATTAAEPDVLILSSQVKTLSNGGLSEQSVLYIISLGLAVFAAVAMGRIVHGFSMKRLLTCVYLTALILSVFAPAEFVPLAFDAGSVTTGVLTTPVVIALATGVSAVLAKRSVSEGFGLLGFASVGPIIAILLLGMLLQ